MTDTEEGYLVFLDPMPLLEYVRPFYDGQPRDNKGRFAHGRMSSSTMRFHSNKVPSAFRSSERYDEIQSMLKARNTAHGEWHHWQVGDFIVGNAGLRHAIRTCPSRPKNIALWNLEDIIGSIDNFHEEEPHEGKTGINKEFVGSAKASIGRSVYRVTVVIEQAADGVNRLHHVRLDPEKKSPQA